MSATALHIQANHAPMAASVQLPGSKSISNRVLTLAAWAKQPILLHNLSDSDDTAVFLRWLHNLGSIQSEQQSGVQLSPSAPRPADMLHSIDLGLAGTALRFIAAACTLLPGSFALIGSERLGQRPVQGLIEALEGAGAHIQPHSSAQVFPLHIQGRPATQPLHYTLNAAASSQLLSALLLLAPALHIGSSIGLTAAPSTPPYVALTLHMLQTWGYLWQSIATGYVLAQQGNLPTSIAMESDWSAASYPLAHLLIRGRSLRLQYLSPDSLQGDHVQLDYWQQLGIKFNYSVNILVATAQPHTSLPAFDFDFATMPDLAQTFAVLALWATGPCTLRGLHTLPHKETDRIAATATELRKLGALVTYDSHSMSITPPTTPMTSARIATYDDHRMAMAFSVAALRCPGLVIEAPQVVAKSYPTFWQDMQALGYTCHPV